MRMLDGILESDHVRKIFELSSIGDVRELVEEYQYRTVLCLSVFDCLEFVDALPRGIARAHHRAEPPLRFPGLRALELWQLLEEFGRNGLRRLDVFHGFQQSTKLFLSRFYPVIG